MSKKFLVITIILLFFVSQPKAYAQGWLYQYPYPTSYTLLGVKFISPEKGWIIGQVGTILYTEESGNKWELQESGTTLRLTNLFFVNDKTGWIAGSGGTILSTEDGGKKWVSQNSGSNNYELYKAFSVDSKEGLIIGCDTDKNVVLYCTVRMAGKHGKD